MNQLECAVGEINVGYLKSGMVLASDLKDPFGRFLIGRGTVLEEKHFRIMKMWGITSADIEGIDQEYAAREEFVHIDPELLPKIQSHVESLFCVPDADSAAGAAGTAYKHEALEEIKRLCVLRLAQQINFGSLKLSELMAEDKKEYHFQAPEIPPQEEIIPALELVDNNVRLSSFPDIYQRIVAIINDTRCSTARLAEVVGNDPGLSATLLKIVNSAFFGLPSKVGSIVRAIALIGNNELSALVMGISVIRYFKSIPPEMAEMKKFWMHSVAAGVFARLLAHHKVDLSEEDLFIAGLLHDIGRLVIFTALPRSAAVAMQLSIKRRVPLFQVEKEVFGYDHAEVAGLLLEKWNFPKPLQQLIRCHHTPLDCQNPVEAAILFLADVLASAMRFGSSGNYFIPHLDKQTWDTLELSTSVLMPCIQQFDRQVDEVLHIFHLDKNSNNVR